MERLTYEDVPSDEMDAWIEDLVRDIVREEISSLAGLALRRLQDPSFTRSIEGNVAAAAAKQVSGHLWGEVLVEYGHAERITHGDETVGFAFPEEHSDK